LVMITIYESVCAAESATSIDKICRGIKICERKANVESVKYAPHKASISGINRLTDTS
jgi:hypothetical protein